MTHSILIIGGGNMGGAIATMLHHADPFTVSIVESSEARRAHFEVMGITTHATLATAKPADSILLAIKPQQFTQFAAELKTWIGGTSPLLISILAGTPLTALESVSANAVRVMPNLPAMIGESMSVACAPKLGAEARAITTKLLGAIGQVAWVEDEDQLHAVTAISGSGPGYVFAFMEALQNAAIAHGLSPALARLLVNQTLRGSALLASTAKDDAATLRAQVTSKNGTTEAALNAFAKGGLDTLVDTAVRAAHARSRELAKN